MRSLQLGVLYGFAAVGIICVTVTTALYLGAQNEREQARVRCPFIRNSLINGRVRLRSRGRIAKFNCASGYTLVGRRFATCIRGQWNTQIPICVTNGCPVINNPANGQMNIQINDALLAFSCDPGYTLRGSDTVYCNGVVWNDTVPICDIATTTPELTCDFEEPNICGWSHDRYHDFDWRRNQFSTPSGHVGTGPFYDHTLGRNNDGFYMYTEASSPRNINDTARLFSPVYFPGSTPGCFVFWYHMYGATTGSLRLYLKKQSQVFRELLPVWEKTGQQGNLWLQGDISIPELKENFQIVIEGIRGNGYVGDTAIDDVALYTTPCEDLVLANISRGADSCQQRCHSDDEINSTCSCKHDCEELKTCCDDYQYFCTNSAYKTDVGLFSIEPPPRQMSSFSENLSSSIAIYNTTTAERLNSSTHIITNVTETILESSTKETSPVVNQTIVMTESPSLAIETTASDFANESVPPLVNSTQNMSSVLSSTPFRFSTIGFKIFFNASEQLSNSTGSAMTTTSPIKMTLSKATTNRQPLRTTSTNLRQYSIEPVSTRKISPPLSTKPSTMGSTRQQTTSPRPLSKTTSSKIIEPSTYKVTPTLRESTTVKKTASSTVSMVQIPDFTKVKPTTSKRLIPHTTSTTAPYSTTTRATTTTTTTRASKTTTQRLKQRRTTSTPRYTTSFKRKTPSSLTTVNARSKTTFKPSTLTTKRFNFNYSFWERTTTRRPSLSTKVTPTTTKSSIYYRTTIKSTTSLPVTSSSKSQTTIRPTTWTSRPTAYTPFTTQSSFSYRNLTQRTALPNITSTLQKSIFTVSSLNNTSVSQTTQQKRLTTSSPPLIARNVSNTTAAATEINLPQTASTGYVQKSSLVTEQRRTHTEKVTTNFVPPKLLPTRTLSTKHQQSLYTTATLTPTMLSDQPIEVQTSEKPDYKSRTNHRTPVQKHSKSSSMPTTVIIAIASCSTAALIFIIVAIFILCRKRKIVQNKLSEDSEMRFLSDSEIVEFMDAASKQQ